MCGRHRRGRKRWWRSVTAVCPCLPRYRRRPAATRSRLPSQCPAPWPAQRYSRRGRRSTHRLPAHREIRATGCRHCRRYRPTIDTCSGRTSAWDRRLPSAAKARIRDKPGPASGSGASVEPRAHWARGCLPAASCRDRDIFRDPGCRRPCRQ